MAQRRHQRRTRLARAVDDPEPIGPLLRRLRLARGLSQMALASKLCDAAASPTLSRHEVSRWECGQRVPGAFWRTWLAVVLQAPLEQLESAAEVARPGSLLAEQAPARAERLWQPPTATEVLATLAHGRVGGMTELAHAWLAGAPDIAAHASQFGVATVPVPDDDGDTGEPLAGLEGRLGVLRRMDDLVGGPDLAQLVDRELNAAVAVLRGLGTGRLRGRALQVVAGYAQLAGWVHTDAGHDLASRRAYRAALHAAAAAGDRQLAAYVLGSLAHQRTAAGRAGEAVEVARAAVAGVRGQVSAQLHALLLHRVAAAAARAGEQREAETALAAAHRAADRITADREPGWLYWLDDAELTAMTGRCLAALGRPARAVRLLTARHADTAAARTAALDAMTLARCYLDLGEIEAACRVAERTLPGAVATGSARVIAQVHRLNSLLLRSREVPAVQRHQRRADRLLSCRPARRPSPAAPCCPGPGDGRH